MLLARDAERRVLVLRRFGDFASRWPNDAVVAVDRSGVVINASQRAPAALHPLAPPTERLRASLAEVVQASTAEGPREVWIHGGGEAYSVVAHPVFDGAVPVGACMVVHLPAVGQRVATASPLGARSGRANGTTRYSLYDLVGESERLREAHRIAIAAAANTLPVLILGESGTGKEMFAQGIHAASRRASLPFVAVNCAAIPSELLESELFGYVGGAFSGARREGSAGKFEAADGGTLFLDELTELPLSAQAALLRVLQEGEVTRVGATQARPVDVRVIAATNCDVIEKLASGGLRSDLYYRLGVLTMELPPLRERRGDIARLARHFLQAAEAELDRPGYTFAPAVLDVFEAYAWPGNVRELNNLVRRLVALAPSDEITLSDLPSTMRPIVEEYRGELREGAAEPEGETAAVRQRIAWAVRHGGTMREAAALLGITRSTLYRQMQRYGLHPERILRGDS
jgi:transcriptional regulator with PAS, ATPase and Fis domain